MKPTRILKKTQLPKGDPRANSPVTWLWHCNDGKNYTTRELAIVLEFKDPHGLYQRIRTLGFDHPDVCVPLAKKGCRLDGTSVNVGRFKEPKVDLVGGDAGTFGSLGNRIRTENLSKIPKPGTWEATL